MLFDLLSLTLLLVAQPGSVAPAIRPAPHRNCPACRGPAGAETSTLALAAGEPCGVYTLSCAPGLRCLPPPQDRSPLQALLQGRGVCSTYVKPGSTAQPDPTGPYPPHSGELEKAPCRKLLDSVLRHLERTHFPGNRDIYIPNCDTRGFYRKKQCHSSKGMQRGLCWCVDQNGTRLQGSEDGASPCDSD
ncbi:hypothetical protein GJAV_G00194620 [Gymnothorax javanicus]|nr:hypothetical protein GJAV_G00194620 [Gymnothorax javanicus]